MRSVSKPFSLSGKECKHSDTSTGKNEKRRIDFVLQKNQQHTTAIAPVSNPVIDPLAIVKQPASSSPMETGAKPS